ISRGSAALVSLSNERENLAVIVSKSAHVLSFSKGSSTQDYPGSQMGSIALLRQTYYDAQWYKNIGSKLERNLSLESWNSLLGLPQIFVVNNKLEALRASSIAKEFGTNYIIKGGGDEYQRLDELKAIGASFILPLNFPDVIDVEDPYDALQISLAELKHWELAPYNLGKVEKSGIEFTLTLAGLNSKGDFTKNLLKAIDNGLSEDGALKALTATPAKLLGVQSEMGTLDKGKQANFFISSGNIFQKDARIFSLWILGKPNNMKELNPPSLGGIYQLSIGDTKYELTASGPDDSPTMSIIKSGDTIKAKVDYKVVNQTISLSFSFPGEKDKTIRLSGQIMDKAWSGRASLPDGSWVNWNASYTAEAKKEDPKKPETSKPEPGAVLYPFIAYGWKDKPKPTNWLIKNATVWTNEKEGNLSGTDVLLQNGKIAKIGKGLTDPTAQVIDGSGKYLTTGIIDEHSHIAISGSVNEGTQSSSAEVRIGDVLNSEDNDMYRQLAGGVTSAHLLHGSANAIGGQTQLIKLRWGYAPEQLKFEGWDGFIKFALGENVKDSNSGDDYTIRFPQSRMGV
ncbi:MAG: amidohydrolase, partial [Sphingobacterium thalpophilum]